MQSKILFWNIFRNYVCSLLLLKMKKKIKSSNKIERDICLTGFTRTSKCLEIGLFFFWILARSLIHFYFFSFKQLPIFIIMEKRYPLSTPFNDSPPKIILLHIIIFFLFLTREKTIPHDTFFTTHIFQIFGRRRSISSGIVFLRFLVNSWNYW